MPPDNYELLKMLCEMYKKLLYSFLERERIYNEKERLMREVAEKAITTTTHDIGSRLASLPVCLQLYKLEEKNRKEIIKLNKRFETILEDVYDSINRAKELLASPIPQYKPFNLVDMLHRSMRMFLHEDNWFIHSSAGNSVVINADERLLRGVISELISNSKRSIEDPEDLTILVTIKLEKEQSLIKITFHDSGQGIPSKIQTKIFNDFYTNRPPEKPGLGLGLSYVKRVIKSHNGTIELDTQEKSGAKFIIHIPLQQTQEE